MGNTLPQILLACKNSIYNTLDRGFKKHGYLWPVSRFVINVTHQEDEIHLPTETQLAVANITCRIIIPRRREFDILRVAIALEPNLGVFVKASDDMVQIVNKL